MLPLLETESSSIAGRLKMLLAVTLLETTIASDGGEGRVAEWVVEASRRMPVSRNLLCAAVRELAAWMGWSQSVQSMALSSWQNT